MELDVSTIEEYSVVQTENGRSVKRNIRYYNLDMILSVGYLQATLGNQNPMGLPVGAVSAQV